MVGLHISQEKSNIRRTNQKNEDRPACVGEVKLECVDKFTYLGSVITNDGDIEADVNTKKCVEHQTATVFSGNSTNSYQCKQKRGKLQYGYRN